jgi:amino acid transporter
VNAIVATAVVGTVLAALVGFGLGTDSLGGQPTTVYYFFAVLASLSIVIVYMGLCIAGAVFFRRTHSRYNPLLHLVLPALGVLIFAAALYGSVYPEPVYPLNLTPYIAHTWVMVGIIAVAFLRNRRPATVRRIGSIVGEEGEQLLVPERVPWWLSR